jgi:hypothetical protein
MNIADELRKLEELHRSGALTDEEFAAAKARVLAGEPGTAGPAGGDAVQGQLDELRLQNEVARLDREWELERPRYLIAGRYGYRYVPNRAMSLLGGVVIVGVGILWTAMASSMVGGFGGVLFFFPLFGVLFILAGIGASVYSYSRAAQYEQAYANYQRRRAQLLAGRPDQREPP